MNTAALIVAAGKSSRMGDFKPMLHLGSITIAERVIANFRQAGISKIVMVTGYHAAELERYLSGLNIVFLRNEQFETTQMFDSVRIGLQYLKDKADRIFFCPVDVPLFTADTVRKMLQIDAPLITPICNGVIGHPILMDASGIDTILSMPDDKGLKGAIDASKIPQTFLDVSDVGIIHDADTPQDYEELLRLHNETLFRPTLQITLSKEKTFFDAQGLMLLTLINETGSVKQAGSRLHISYSNCWNIIRTMESQLKNPLILRVQGGKNGSHSDLTEYGKMLIRQYTLFSKDVQGYADQIFQNYFGELFHD